MYFTSGPLLEYEKMMQEIPRGGQRPDHQPVQRLPLPGLDYRRNPQTAQMEGEKTNEYRK